MIVCGWCGNATEPVRCSSCGRNPALPWEQRAIAPPTANDEKPGRPKLDASQIRSKVRIARKQLGDDATNADLAELLDVSERTLGRWLKLAS